MQTEEFVRELPKGLLKWYEFQKGSSVLYVATETKKCEPLVEALSESGLQVDTVDILFLEQGVWKQGACRRYDYIVVIEILERCRKPEAVLQTLKNMLAPTGTLLLGTDNRLGVRYFCGDKDPFT